MVKTYTISLVLLLTSVFVYGQETFATVKLNSNKVLPYQPIKATVTVLTATWFTQPLEFEPIQMQNAFVLSFKRTVSGIHYVGNKQYAGLEFFYLIYPYQPGEYTLPPITIEVTTPKEGDYIGKKVVVKTKPQNITVLDIPSNFEGEEWMVAKNVHLKDSWSAPLSEVKVGDVINRKIDIAVQGALPQFIPDLSWSSIPFGTIYEKAPELKDTRTKSDANGSRVENLTYLFDKEGAYEIPALTIIWWNPYAQRQYQKTIPAKEITVQPNKDLNMLTSIRDSLSLETSVEKVNGEERLNLPFGLRWSQLGIVILLLILLLWMGIKMGKRIRRVISLYRKRYYLSEAYYRKLIRKANGSGSNALKIKAVYDWWMLVKAKQEGYRIPAKVDVTGWQVLLNNHYEYKFHEDLLPQKVSIIVPEVETSTQDSLGTISKVQRVENEKDL